jgi:hypothetical protein
MYIRTLTVDTAVDICFLYIRRYIVVKEPCDTISKEVLYHPFLIHI